MKNKFLLASAFALLFGFAFRVVAQIPATTLPERLGVVDNPEEAKGIQVLDEPVKAFNPTLKYGVGLVMATAYQQVDVPDDAPVGLLLHSVVNPFVFGGGFFL
ncbi:hypothetical protein Barb7_00580 [Bacteroidales bacterium Barb7]|nr:hypothetical protein Barb7_00580 [Bacteroidales bacterium Barb7]